MSHHDRRIFERVLSMAQNKLRLVSERTASPVTPELIDREVARLALFMEEEFQHLDREALTDELILLSSHSAGTTATLSSPEGHRAWLSSARKQGWVWWPRYAAHMETRIPWSARDAMDSATDEVLGQLEDPRREGVWDRRGLVVGHVQSGKTANYTGLICKAADAGYKIIIVLAGLHNNLRAQTQIRLDEGFLGFATMADVMDLPAVGVDIHDRDPAHRPDAATNRSDKGDFTSAMASRMNISPEERPWLFVVKKNAVVLERLLHWIRNRVVDATDPETGRGIVTGLPLLVIDDESDHGSVDTGEAAVDEFGRPDPEHEPTVLNRQILHHFARKACVGYAATPFDNIFIHERGETAEHGPNLFPAAFISSLAAPSNYVGPSKVFAALHAGELPLVRELQDAEWQQWIPVRHPAHHRPRWEGEDSIPPSLAEAIRAFILSCAVRKLRGQGAKHCSMLVHTSRFTAVQAEVAAQVGAFLRDLRGRFLRGIEVEAVEAQLRAQYEGDFLPGMLRIRAALPPGEDAFDPSWQEIRACLPAILSDIRLREINGSARDALDYAENDETGLKVIAIGGEKLSRGLTLEGLTTSWFLRSTKMYDTLMQMGRWFGYRDGWLDLCRLCCPGELVEWFSHIADVAEELRQELDTMVASGASPRQFGLRVRGHSVLSVTWRAKMRHAQPMQLSWSGDLIQTQSLLSRREDIHANFREGERFVASLGTALPLSAQHHLAEGVSRNGWLWCDVPGGDVAGFLHGFRSHPGSFRAHGPLVAEFIEAMMREGELRRWTVDEGADGAEGVDFAGLRQSLLHRSGRSGGGDHLSIRSLVPPKRKLTRKNIAKYHEAWRGRPAQVACGGEKNFAAYMQALDEDPGIVPDPLDAAWYRAMIAKVILFRAVETMIRTKEARPIFRQSWVNVATYVTAPAGTRLGDRIDLDQIWLKQGLSQPLKDLLWNWAVAVNGTFERLGPGQQISEVAKRAETWNRMRELDLGDTPGGIPEPRA